MRLILNRELGLWCNVYSGKLGEVHTHTHTLSGAVILCMRLTFTNR